MPISLFYQKRIMKHTISLFIWTVCILLLPLEFIHAENNPTELLKKLQSLPGITDIKPLESNAYPEKYVLFIEQLLDPKHPEAGSFKQRIILGHIGFDRPTILVTEGYAATYALAPRYQEELSKRLNANLVFVEYRYFDASMPDLAFAHVCRHDIVVTVNFAQIDCQLGTNLASGQYGRDAL